jgi:glycosyltransferase involved in cell wall biosynthesis
MRIAIIHHHLHQGGVTRVIESQLNALPDYGNYKLTVHTGDPMPHLAVNNLNIDFYCCESLRYLTDDLSEEQIHDTFEKIARYLEQVAGANDILHFHNLNLGKNPLLTLASYNLAKRGLKIINHCHDFAEDRPRNYAFLESIIQGYFGKNINGILYPPLNHYHYIVLTSKDHDRLLEYGVQHERINLLPNPVTFLMNKEEKLSQETAKKILGVDKALKLCLYPVRAIHRKNIGEFILLSVLLQKQASWMITQPPQNPVEIPEYERWKDFCSALQIPVIFEAGKIIDFHNLLPAVDFCITTSIMEGFGLAFMEPWLAGIPVIGRNINYCTADLKRNGIRFPLLYDRFIVSFRKERIDFKDLDPMQQQQVIQEILLQPGKLTEVIALNPFLRDFLKPVEAEIILHNQQVIREKYSLESYGQQLHGIYKKLSGRA